MRSQEHWIAWPLALLALPPVPESACWWAMEFSPRVAVLEDALLLETSQVQRLWGGLQPLLARLEEALGEAREGASLPEQPTIHAEGNTPWLALARLRWRQYQLQHLQSTGKTVSVTMAADALPLWTLTALQPHCAALLRMGCQTWGQLRALPRAGLSRRIGAKPLRVLDEAYGLLPQPLNWLKLPEQFVLRHDLGYPAHSADAVLHATQPLLRALQAWLQARHHAVLALQLRWHHDLRRIDGQELPAWAELSIRTAQPTQGMEHLQRLLREHLSQQRWRAPVDMLELKALDTVPWSAAPLSCLPDLTAQQNNASGLAWHEWVERLSARWGDAAVQTVEPCADHRPEAMQRWQAASTMAVASPKKSAKANNDRAKDHANDCADPWQALWPPWLLSSAQALTVQNNRPHWHGPLQLRAGPYRLESGWWEGAEVGGGAQSGLAVRDYFVAFNEVVGHVWIYRERAQTEALLTPGARAASWFVQGVYG
jgi:protein ImuB